MWIRILSVFKLKNHSLSLKKLTCCSPSICTKKREKKNGQWYCYFHPSLTNKWSYQQAGVPFSLNEVYPWNAKHGEKVTSMKIQPPLNGGECYLQTQLGNWSSNESPWSISSLLIELCYQPSPKLLPKWKNLPWIGHQNAKCFSPTTKGMKTWW